MSSAIINNIQPSRMTKVTSHDEVTITPVENSPAQWYRGIASEVNSGTGDLNVQIVDKGNSMEFVLPPKTAQFAEMSVLDTKGKLVWKTQSFNKNTIVWHKQTTLGRRVPQGRYTFRMKQGDHQVDFALVA